MRKREKDLWFGRFSILIMGSLAAAVMAFMVRLAYLGIQERSPEWKTRFQQEFPGLEAADALSPESRRGVVQWANAERCSCRCGYTIASCLKLDSTCPNRPSNLQRVAERIETALNDGSRDATTQGSTLK
ncbi:MAG: hypothetical protein NUW21_12175 [Elusimicrobia bacterium]|nr:hypothetical protein [Elusimicrobiota bacterium]